MNVMWVNEFYEIRSRLHRKSHEYYVFSHDRWDKKRRSMFYGATDALADTGQAAESYRQAITENIGVNLLACYGFLQALYVQQDAVKTLSDALGLNWNPNEDGRLKEIREARNRLTGHPALAGKHEKPRRLSSAIIPYSEIDQTGFRGHVYYEDGFEDIHVNALEFQRDNQRILALQMLTVEKKMDEAEDDFRKSQAIRPLSRCFQGDFDYLLQRLHTDLTDAGRVGQAQTHAKMIRERLELLEVELAERGFGPEASSLQVVFTGVNLLESVMSRTGPTMIAQHEFDLIYDGVEKKIRTIMVDIEAIDEKLRRPIP